MPIIDLVAPESVQSINQEAGIALGGGCFLDQTVDCRIDFVEVYRLSPGFNPISSRGRVEESDQDYVCIFQTAGSDIDPRQTSPSPEFKKKEKRKKKKDKREKGKGKRERMFLTSKYKVEEQE